EYAPARRATATRGAEAERMLGTLPSQRTVVDDVIDPVTGEPCWLVSEPVSSSGWTVGVVFFKEQSAQNRLLRRQGIRFVVSLFVPACLGLPPALEPYRRNTQETAHDVAVLWVGTGAGSFLLLVGIGWLWFIAYGAKHTADTRDTLFVDKGSVRRFVLDTTRTGLKQKGTLPLFVPTGVFLQPHQILRAINIAPP